ncbi:hypothetical protein ACGF12_30375 [Kitasatospora sp. NPDC048296]|uniref:hypothetical protein n=1 Tax=Kitasatospora sp. NPDC048296 TaxID=3364048 RepID=UPI00371ECFD2
MKPREHAAARAAVRRIRAALEEYEALVNGRPQGSLSFEEVCRREDLVRLLCKETRQQNRSSAIKRARKIAANPSLYRPKRVKPKLWGAATVTRADVVAVAGFKTTPRAFDADQVRKVVPTAVESSRRH